MSNINLFIISQNSHFHLEFDCHEDDLDTIIGSVFYPFMNRYDKENNTIEISEYQQNTLELRNRIKDIVEELKSCNLEIYKLYAYFSKNVNENQWFFIADKKIETEQCKQIQYQLSKWNTPDDVDILTKANNLRNRLEEIYDIKVYNQDTTDKIGEKDKYKRICRYCKKSYPEVSFKKVAHTISESFGNKNIITNDECDSCNQLFGDTIESDFIRIFDFPRVIFHIIGKNGEPKKLEGKNYTLFNNTASGEFKIQIKKDNNVKGDVIKKEWEQILEPFQIPSTINIYKCLVKYAIGVLEESTLLSLDKTIQWLKNEIHLNNLPPIAMKINNTKIDHPQMCLFVKKDTSNPHLPHILASIQLINTTFVYIIPFSVKDNFDFSKYENFTNTLDWFEIFTGQTWNLLYCDENPPIIKLKIKHNNSL